MELDVWFCRQDDHLYFVVANHDEAPTTRPLKVASVGTALRKIKVSGHVVAQVGILDPEMIGLDVEV